MKKSHAAASFSGESRAVCAVQDSLGRVSENPLMNRRVWVCVGLVFACALAVNRAGAQQFPAGSQSLAVNIKNAANAESYVKDIRQFILDQVVHLQSPDIAAQALAQRKLVEECPGGSAVSPSFYAVYCREWSNAAKLLIAPGNPMRLRLHVAIISAGLAATATLENSRNLDLEPVVDLALADKDGSVAMWGIRAARPLILILVQQPPVTIAGKSTPAVTASKMVAGIVAAVKLHTDPDPANPSPESHRNYELSGFLVLDAYHSLAIKDVPGVDPKLVGPYLPPLVSPVLDILEIRIAQYTKGAIPMPGAERDVTTFLSATSYQTATPANQKRIREDLVTLITYAGQRSWLYTSKSELSQLREMLKYSALGLTVIAGYVNDQGAVSGLIPITSLPLSAPPADIETRTKSVWSTMNLDFKDMAKPPAIPVMMPPPAPAPDPAAATPAPKP